MVPVLFLLNLFVKSEHKACRIQIAQGRVVSHGRSATLLASGGKRIIINESITHVNRNFDRSCSSTPVDRIFKMT